MRWSDLIELYDAEAAAKKAVKEAQAALDEHTLKQVRRPHRGRHQGARARRQVGRHDPRRIDGEVNALTLALVARIQQLGERYAETVERS